MVALTIIAPLPRSTQKTGWMDTFHIQTEPGTPTIFNTIRRSVLNQNHITLFPAAVHSIRVERKQGESVTTFPEYIFPGGALPAGHKMKCSFNRNGQVQVKHIAVGSATRKSRMSFRDIFCRLSCISRGPPIEVSFSVKPSPGQQADHSSNCLVAIHQRKA